MKKFVFVLALPVYLTGCYVFAGSGSVTNDITVDNHWQYLSITIVDNRLQVFSEIEGASFDNVLLTYQIYNPSRQTRVLLLSSSGIGETQECLFLFPIILNISGIVNYSSG
ncbi:MAG: hypothetical protein FWE31_01240 [Firmicutes bacterium]|nr:hypothetical protein [Bacillota bacterium]